MKQSKHIQWPHWVNEEEQVVHVHVNGWISALGASTLVKKWFPGYRCDLVSEERLAGLQKEVKEKE